MQRHLTSKRTTACTRACWDSNRTSSARRYAADKTTLAANQKKDENKAAGEAAGWEAKQKAANAAADAYNTKSLADKSQGTSHPVASVF